MLLTLVGLKVSRLPAVRYKIWMHSRYFKKLLWIEAYTKWYKNAQSCPQLVKLLRIDSAVCYAAGVLFYLSKVWTEPQHHAWVYCPLVTLQSLKITSQSPSNISSVN